MVPLPMRLITLCCMLMLATGAAAAEVDFRDYIGLNEGMTEAEVLYRLGPCDHETFLDDFPVGFHHLPLRKRWAYLPPRGQSGWITEITFNAAGRVSSLERYPP
jgi:hypothetical protein